MQCEHCVHCAYFLCPFLSMLRLTYIGASTMEGR